MESIREIYRVGKGPSSSHTMGTTRASEMFLERFPEADHYRITLYGSLAATGKGHLTDKAVMKVFEGRKTSLVWEPSLFLPRHPNALKFEAFDGQAIATEILHGVTALAQEQNMPVLHGIVDCVFVQGGDIERFKATVESRYQILSEYESYDWICFLPQKDGTGSSNTYLGRLTDGTIKIRGLAARRKDTPPYVKLMQEEVLDLLAEAGTKAEIADRQADALAIYRRYDEHLPRADPALFVIRKKMGRSEYQNNCISAAVIAACQEDGVSVAAGMDCRYLITDAKARKVVPEWQAAGRFDVGHYRTLLRRAWEEVWWVFVLAGKENGVLVRCAPAYPRGEELPPKCKSIFF